MINKLEKNPINKLDNLCFLKVFKTVFSHIYIILGELVMYQKEKVKTQILIFIPPC